ncbi:hypothetical protein EDC04DRAFT_2989156 [Pisolithus marmoratus]|nr:hypothetical protein EDC04DRAFT_2989156 [Pisolithus marmoratus]
MATALTCFKPYSWPDNSRINSLDAKAVACKDHWVITSPNVDFVPEPHIFREEDLQPHADGHFGAKFAVGKLRDMQAPTQPFRWECEGIFWLSVYAEAMSEFRTPHNLISLTLPVGAARKHL